MGSVTQELARREEATRCYGTPSKDCPGCWQDRGDPSRQRSICKGSMAYEPPKPYEPPIIQQTPAGMVREDKSGKLAYLDYFTPAVLARYGEHMRKNGERHGSDNWKKGGYPQRQYLQSAFRHLLALWSEIDGDAEATDEDHASAMWFNIVGLIYEQERTKKGAA